MFTRIVELVRNVRFTPSSPALSASPAARMKFCKRDRSISNSCRTLFNISAQGDGLEIATLIQLLESYRARDNPPSTVPDSMD
ncbi:MAG: hypothetical protein Q9161_008847 [Pseudevernia consocians]